MEMIAEKSLADVLADEEQARVNEATRQREGDLQVYRQIIRRLNNPRQGDAERLRDVAPRLNRTSNHVRSDGAAVEKDSRISAEMGGADEKRAKLQQAVSDAEAARLQAGRDWWHQRIDNMGNRELDGLYFAAATLLTSDQRGYQSVDGAMMEQENAAQHELKAFEDRQAELATEQTNLRRQFPHAFAE